MQVSRAIFRINVGFPIVVCYGPRVKGLTPLHFMTHIAGQNQRFVTGPGLTLATYPVTNVCNRQALVVTTPPLALLFLVILSRVTIRDKGKCNKPRVSYPCNKGCWRGSSGTGLRRIAI